MALDGVEFSIKSGPEWDRVIAALDDVAATLGMEIRDAVSRLVDPWMADAEARVISTPIKGVGRQTGLRAEVAASVEKSVTGTVDKFEVDVTSSMPGGSGEENEAIIPLGMDRPTGWRHPVFGNRNNWVTQIALRDHWFSGAFNDHHDDVSNEIQDMLDHARDKIAGAGG